MIRIGANYNNTSVNRFEQNNSNKRNVSFGAIEKTFLGIVQDSPRLSKDGIEIAGEAKLKMLKGNIIKGSREMFEKHFESLKDKPSFNKFIEFITGKPFGAYVLEGEGAIQETQRAVSAFGMQNPDKKFLITCSKNSEEAAEQIKRFFPNMSV